MRLKLIKSTGSPDRDRWLLLCGGMESAILLSQFKDRILIITAEDRGTFGDASPDDGQWFWRYPLRLLHKCECVHEGAHRLRFDDDDFAQLRGKRFCCSHYQHSYTGIWLFDTTPDAEWQCIYEDIGYIAENLEDHNYGDIRLYASTGDMVSDRRRLCYRRNAGVVLAETDGILLVALPRCILVCRATTTKRLCFDTVQWNEKTYEFTGNALPFDFDLDHYIYVSVNDMVRTARDLPAESDGHISDYTGPVIVRRPWKPGVRAT